MSGLCSVLDSLRQSLESESESENDDLDPDGNSSTNSHALSWQGSLQQLPTTPSTSESEAGNMASEHHLCRQCGRARRRERARASGCSSLPPGRRLRPRLKKRAHFATDTDNSSDPERLSDSHESSLLFKPIAPSPNYMSTPLVSLSPREVKSVTFTSDTRPASTSALPTAQTKVTRPDTLMTCTSSPSGLASRAAPPSLDIAKGRKPFKADHELFKRHPSGLPCPAPVGQRPQARPSSSSTTSPTSPVPAAAVAGSGSPALPPRHPLKQTHTGYGKQHQPQHHNSSPNRNHHHHHHHHHQYHHQHQHHIYQKRRNSLSSGALSDPTRDSGYGSSATLTDSTHGRGGDGGDCASDNNVEHRGRQCSKRGPPIAPRSASASRIGARDNFRHAMQQPPPPPPPPPPSSSFLQPSSPASSSPTAILLLPPPPPSLLVTPPDSPTAELPPPPPPLQLPGSETSPKLLSPTSPSQLLPPPHLPNLDLALSKQPSPPLPPPPSSQPVSGTPPIHPSVHNINKNCAKRTSLDDNQNLPGPRSNLQQMWDIARRSSRLTPDSETNNTTSNMSTKLYPDNTLAKRNSCTEAVHVTPPPRYEDAIKRVNVFRPAGSGPSSDHQSQTRADSMSVVSGTVTANGTKVKTSEVAPPVTRQNGTGGGAPVPCSGLEDTTPDTSYCSDRGGGQSPSPMQSGFVGQSIRQFEARAVSTNSRNKFDYTTRNVSSSDRKDGAVGELMAGSGLPPRPTSSSKPMNGLAYQGGFRNHHGGKQSGTDVTPPVSGSLSNGHSLVPGFCREDSHVSDEVFLIDDDSRDDFADQSSGSSDNTDEKKRKPSNLIKSAIDERHLTYNRNDSGTKKLPDHDRNSKNIILEFLV